MVDGNIFEPKLALTQDWFAVFTGNAVHLGKFEADVSRGIITTYALVKGLIEQLRINNQLLDMRSEITFQVLRDGETPFLKGRKEIVHEWLVQQAIKIRKSEAALTARTLELFTLLDHRGIK